MDDFLWWSGVALWFVAGLCALLFAGEKLMAWILLRLRLKRDFLLWCAYRIIKANRAALPHSDTQGK